MKRKIFRLENLNRNNKIVITSQNNCIDFLKESTHIVVYFDDFPKPEHDLFAERHILYNNQPQTTVFELPVKGHNAKIEIKAITDFDIDKIIVNMSSI